MNVRKKRSRRALKAIKAICASKDMGQFYIGFTSLPALRKGASYFKNGKGFEYLVLLADKLKCQAALDLEEDIHTYISEHRRDVRWRRYYAEKKSDGALMVRRSCGGRCPHRHAKEKCKKFCSIYMTWWDK